MKNSYIFKFIFVFFLMILITSCVSKKKMIYFQDEEAINTVILNTYAPKIQPDDELNIIVSGKDPLVAKPFNLFQAGGQTSTAKPITYLVDSRGLISFPVLGNIKVEGMSTDSLKVFLTKKLEPFLSEPIVTIRPVNFRVSVLGEVRNPGIINLVNERVTIAEAIGLAGDLTIHGKRENILMIRSTQGKYKRIRLDLTDQSLFSSPYFYLAQNDIIYIEPNRAKVNSSAIGTTASLISVVSAILSLVLIITR